MIKKFSFILVIFLSIAALLFPQRSPDEFFGKQVGSDRTLIKYPDIIRYFQYLDSESKRLTLSDEGKSTLGNSMILAFISSEENLAHLPELIEINKILTNPDTLDKTKIPGLIEKGKVFVLITCSIHATEIAASQMSLIFAHQLVSGNNPGLTRFLDDVVILLMPSINPDGNIMVTDWYNKYLDTEYEGCNMPYLYHHYAGHDNNRDFFMLNLKETKAVNSILHHKYFPHIFLDMHQMGITGPRMFVPPFKDPLNMNLNPLMLRETDIIGTFMALKLQETNKKGVATSYAFDAYWPGGSKNTAWYKNVVGVLTEMASVRVATPVYVESNELSENSKGLPEYKAQVNFPDPWQGGWWRLNDIIDYELIAAKSLVEITSRHREAFLSNYLQLGTTAIEKGNTDKPYGYIIPLDQWDLPTAYAFLQRMEEGGTRIFTLDADTQVGSTIYKKGDFIIPLNQPYRSFIKTMMERQHYPEIKFMTDGPIIEPYDSTGWTLPLMMGVKTIELNTPTDQFKMTRVQNLAFPTTMGFGEGNYYCLFSRFNNSSLVANRLLKKGVKVFRATETDPSAEIEAGDFLVKTADIDTGPMAQLLSGTGIDIIKRKLDNTKILKEIRKPRLAIYQPYSSNMDEGWTRWVLDTFDFEYTILHKGDFNLKKLKGLDVILFADMGRDSIVENTPTGNWAYYAQGMPPEFKGGIGKEGVEVLKTFVKEGGSIILLDSAAELGITDFMLPFTNIFRTPAPNDFDCPGSILKLTVDTADPIGWGMEKDNIIYFSESPAFKTRIPILKTINRKVVAGFNEDEDHLLSGYLKGGKLLDKAAMIIRFDYYKGKVMVLGGRVQFRAQTFGTFKFLFNSIFFSCM